MVTECAGIDTRLVHDQQNEKSFLFFLFTMSNRPHRSEPKHVGTLQDTTVFDQPGPDDAGFVTFTFVKRLCRFRPQTHEQTRLHNNSRKTVGLLEVANLGDVAANVWNTIPIPAFIVFFMILGGSIALSMLYFVITDAILSWGNIQRLRAERSRLQVEKEKKRNPGPERRSIDSFLHVNLRELGSECMDRLGMVVLLGIGAFLVGIGTFMAPAGANQRIFEASNYLTGFVGNAPCAIFGLLNVGWAFFVCRRAYGHRRAIEQRLGLWDDKILANLLDRRTKRIYLHGIVNGTTVLVAGAAAMLTATKPWAYAVLSPCCISSFFLNWYWLRMIGYDRPLQDQGTMVSSTALRDAIHVTIGHQEALKTQSLDSSSVMGYIAKHRLLEDLCLQVLNDRGLRKILVPEASRSRSIPIQCQTVMSWALSVNGEDAERFRKAAKEVALQFCRYRERWLLETLGCHMSILEQEGVLEQEDKRGSGSSEVLGKGNFSPYSSFSPSSSFSPTLSEYGIPIPQGDCYRMFQSDELKRLGDVPYWGEHHNTG